MRVVDVVQDGRHAEPSMPADAPGIGDMSASRDELLLGGTPRPEYAGLVDLVERLGDDGLAARAAEARRLLEDDGVSYGGSGPGLSPSRWELDPLPLVIGAAEWSSLEAGVRQRAEVLTLVLADLYGPRDLIRHGVIPPEVVLGHDGFLRAVDGVEGPLFMASADLARGADGAWTVLCDRTQAPSGAGYAMENRRVTMQVLPGLHRDTAMAPLRPFFDTMREELRERSRADDSARIVLLTPGAASETAFDQAFLATLLGFPLVEADDLVVREGQVWLRTTSSDLEPVHVILRRVDAEWCDPLELRPDSQLGVAGLIEAQRAGSVALANPLGAGVLENAALLPYLSDAARALTGSDLDLPAAATWWCGDPASRSHVLANLDTLVVKPIVRTQRLAGRFGWLLTADQRADLARRIAAEPWAWVGQEAVQLSTAPTVTRTGLEARQLVLRTFAVDTADGYVVLPGGLGRVAGREEPHLVSNLSGALAKDVWVLTEDEVDTTLETVSPRPTERVTLAPLPTSGGLSPRVADDLFWMGRYAERAEGTARLLRVVDALAQDHGSRPGHRGSPGWHALQAMLRATEAVTTSWPFPGEAPACDEPTAAIRRLSIDPSRPGSVAFAARRTIEAAQEVREQLSLDTWIVLSRLDRTLDDTPAPDAPLRPMLGQVIESFLAFAGLSAESIVRDDGWAVTDAGRRVERATQTVALLRHGFADLRPAAVENVVVESVLLACESVVTYRRRQVAGTRAARPVPLLLSLLLLDPDNPRSVRHQLDRLTDDFARLHGEIGVAPAAAAALGGRLSAVVGALDSADPWDLVDGDRARLAELLDGVLAGLSGLAEEFERVHCAHKAPQLTLPTRW